MTIASVDLETFAVCDIKKCGGHRYSRDPLTEWLMLAVGLDDEEPGLWVPEQWRSIFDGSGVKMLATADLAILCDPETVLYAHNATGFEVPQFDALFTKTTGFPAPAHHQWRCTAAMARRAALPASLAKCAEALKLPMQKSTEGMALIRKFSIPQTPKARSKKEFRERIYPHDDPEAFRRFGEYCLQDVRVERQIHKALKAFELKGFPLETFQLDLTINSRGLPVNLDGLRKAQALVEEVTEEVSAKFRALTGLEPTQSARLLEWLKEHGYKGDDLKAETLEDQIEEMDFAEDDIVGQALKLRQQVSFAAVKKIPAMLACAGPDDNRVRGTLIYHGAGPGRWSGALVQPQNFKRPTVALAKFTEMAYADICNDASREYLELMYGNTLDVVASSIRHFLDCGSPMFSADYAAIEARIVCWLAGQEDALEEYRQRVDRYVRMASLIYGIPEKQVNKHPQRFIGKQATLGCGFGMGGPKFRATCEKFQYYDLEEDLEFTAVSAFRERHPKVVTLWADTEKAAKSAIGTTGQTFAAGKMTLFCRQVAGMKYLFMRLPSGRCIAYPDVKLEPQMRYATAAGMQTVINPTVEQIASAKKKYGERAVIISQTISFFGQIPLKQIWGRISTYGGKLVENATQGVAADVMAQGAINAERAGYETATLIHDEFLGYKQNGQNIDELVKLLTTLPAWAAGLPIEAEGGEVKFYTK